MSESENTVPKRYRLTARAEINGAIRDPGFVFTLPLDADGHEIKGPHRSVVASNHGAQITDHENAESGLVDVPLYEEVTEPEPVADEAAVELAPEHAADRARIADLEAQLADKDTQLGEAHWRLSEVEAALKVSGKGPEPEDGKPLLLEKPISTLQGAGEPA